MSIWSKFGGVPITSEPTPFHGVSQNVNIPQRAPQIPGGFANGGLLACLVIPPKRAYV